MATPVPITPISITTLRVLPTPFLLWVHHDTVLNFHPLSWEFLSYCILSAVGWSWLNYALVSSVLIHLELPSANTNFGAESVFITMLATGVNWSLFIPQHYLWVKAQLSGFRGADSAQRTAKVDLCEDWILILRTPCAGPTKYIDLELSCQGSAVYFILISVMSKFGKPLHLGENLPIL